MKIKDLSIGTQLKLGLSAMLIFVLALGITSYIQSDLIQKQTETLYNHPLLVQNAIGELKSDILSIHREVKDMVISADEKEMEQGLNRIAAWESNASEQINLLYDRYLGPLADIDSVRQAFIEYNSIRIETVRLLRSGNITEVANRTKRAGIAGMQVEVLLEGINKIESFAKNKAETLYKNSVEYHKQLTKHLLILIIAILILSFLINYILLRNIRKPLKELTEATQRFDSGDKNARSTYKSENEFGVLTASFNTLAEGIQANTELSHKVVSLASLMLSKYEAKEFFRETINALAAHTGSQIAAVYLLSDDKKNFDHFESLGMDNDARQSFSAGSYEGEFGIALSSHAIQHIKNIPDDTRFVFNTVSGKFIPHEIITIPILTDNEVVALISLASVSSYSQQSLHLIDSILTTLRARVEGIIAYHKMRIFSEKLEQQNRELATQKTELSAQSAEMKEQNIELEVQKNQLSEANQLKTNFLSNMSHELRTPLNSVIALSGVLNRRLAKQIPEEEYSYLEVIERNGKHLLQLINDILDISRIEAGHEEIEITKFDINSLIKEIISTIQPQADQKKIELIHTPIHSDLSLVSDNGKCRHILQNLISNAVKFTETGKVEVNSRQTNNAIEISVTDSGIGISPQHLPHIFDEFRQADSSTSRKFGGTGLGLAIAKKYAALLGGTISVKSTPGSGSEFTLFLPLLYVLENTTPDAESTKEISPARKQNTFKPAATSTIKTILLVEDSEPAIIQIRDILEETKYILQVARNGSEALGILEHTIPDAMILDLMMPGIDGFEVLQTLREAEQTAEVPVLILTAKHITKEELKFLTRNNIHQLIQKGDINRKELLSAVSSMVSVEKQETVKPRELQTIEGKPTVLIVEDNPDNMISIKALLDDTFLILEAVDGHEGVKMAKLHQPNLILMDIALPVLDGIEAFQTIRRDTHLQQIPVIALTASAMTSDRETILAYGFDAYIAKPIDFNSFFITINEVLYGK